MNMKKNPEEGEFKEINPFEYLMEQLEGMVNFLESKKGVPINETYPLDPSLVGKIAELEDMVVKFQQLGQQIVNLSGVSLEELRKRQQGKSTEVNFEGKQIIDRSNKLKLQAESLRSSYQQGEDLPIVEDHLPPSTHKSEYEKIKETKDTKFGKKRRGKFKQMGGDKDWKPL